MSEENVQELESEVLWLKEQLDREEQRYKRQMLQARQEAQERDREAEVKMQRIVQLEEQLERVTLSTSGANADFLSICRVSIQHLFMSTSFEKA